MINNLNRRTPSCDRNLVCSQNSHRPRRKSKCELGIFGVDTRLGGYNRSLGDGVRGVGVIVSDDRKVRRGQTQDCHVHVLDFTAVVGQLGKVGVLGAGSDPVDRSEARVTGDFLDGVTPVHGE